MDVAVTGRPWPVSWEPAVAMTLERGNQPDTVLTDPRFAAHRVLDQLAALAAEVLDGLPGARAALRERLDDVLSELPWLTPPRGQSPRSTDGDHVPCGSETSATYGPVSLINDDGVSSVAAVARALIGEEGATAIHRLVAAARAAELLVAEPAPVSQAETSSPATILDATHAKDFWDQLVRTDPFGTVSPCQTRLNQISIDDLDQFPPPTGTSTHTTGITRVDVPDPCGPAARMTIHGQGFGARRPSNVDVVVATWDDRASQLNYQVAQNITWADDTIVVQLTTAVVPGYAAFADLDFIKTYNAWADARNTRVNAKMRAAGCPGRWTVEIHLPLNPAPDPAAAYKAGAPVLIGELVPTAGSVQMWDSTTVHLHCGDTFRIAWRVYGADTVILASQDDGSGEVFTAAGYPASGPVLTPQDGDLTFTAPAAPARAEFLLAADNGCGTAWIPLNIVVTHPPLAPATVTLFQSLAVDADVTVTPGPAGEVLNPADGNTIPLVAGKRTVARIDWWPGVEQPPTTDPLSAEVTLTVSGDMLPRGGVTVLPFASTADSAPPPDPIVQAGPPGFTTLAQYEQWVVGGGRTNPFYVVLPPELCLGGTLLGTPRQALTVIDATITVTTADGAASWTVNAGIEVTFHPRRTVTLRYLPYATSDASLAPTDDQCEAALKTAGTMLPVPDPDVVRLPGPAVTAADGHLIEDLEAQRTALQGPFSDAWRDEIWVLMGPSNFGGVSVGEYVIAASTDPVVCAHEIGHEYHQNHLDVCGNVPYSDPMSSWPDDGHVPVEGWDEWNSVDVAPGCLDVMAYRYCTGAGWMHPERWRRMFIQAGPPA